MSDLQEVIATSSINAYNSGLEQGRRMEHQRAVSLLVAMAKCDPEVCFDGCNPSKCAAPVVRAIIEIVNERT
jgi:hypothetical protein